MLALCGWIFWIDQPAIQTVQKIEVETPTPAAPDAAQNISSQIIELVKTDNEVVIDQTVGEQSQSIPVDDTLSTQEILSTLHQRSRPELAALATGVADYFEEELLGFYDLYRFTDRLLRIKLNASDDLILSDSAVYGVISFANSDSVGMGESWEKNEFSNTETRIVAHLPQIDMEVLGNKALVSWSRIEDGELLLLNTMAMDPTAPRNNVWLEYPWGWQPGNYRVAIYSGDEQLSLLSSGEFRVVASTPIQ
jgi:hypothetical protein